MTTTAPGRQGELRFRQETVAGEAIAAPSTYWVAGLCQRLRSWDWDFSDLKYNSIADPSVQSRYLRNPARIMTAKGGSVKCKAFLTALNQTAATGVTVTQDSLGLLLQAAWGGQQRGVSRAITAGSTTTVINVANTNGLVVGLGVLINGEARRITVVTTNTSITLDMALTSAPGASDLIKAALTVYPDPDYLADIGDAGRISLACLLRGSGEDQYQLRGVYPQVEIESVKPGGEVTLAITLHCMDWEIVTGTTADIAPTEGTVAIARAGGLYWQTLETTTKNTVHTKDIAVKLGMSPQPIESPVATQGVAGFVVVGGEPTTVETTVMYDDDWHDWYEAQTAKYAGLQFSTAALLSLPCCYQDQTPVREADGPTGGKIAFHANEATGSGSTDLEYARFALHRLPA